MIISANNMDLFPPLEPFDSGHLPVSDIHKIYYEQSGKIDGKPVLYLHGGPGGGTSPRDRRYFDPAAYRIILMDQRGAGKSLPPAELKDNTSWDLVEDIEKLRKHLGIDKWVVFGGSWGCSLSLLYAETHPTRVKAIVVRGIFTGARRELIWLYQEGASRIFPDYWEDFSEPIPVVQRHDMMSAYYRKLTSEDEEERLKYARHWSRWEMSTARLFVDEELVNKAESDHWALQFARIECHYFVHGCFLESDNYILDNVDKIRHIPCTIIHGRYDMECPGETAWQLHKKFPEADFHWVHDAGHSAKEPGIASSLVAATEKYKTL